MTTIRTKRSHKEQRGGKGSNRNPFINFIARRSRKQEGTRRTGRKRRHIEPISQQSKVGTGGQGGKRKPLEESREPFIQIHSNQRMEKGNQEEQEESKEPIS